MLGQIREWVYMHVRGACDCTPCSPHNRNAKFRPQCRAQPSSLHCGDPFVGRGANLWACSSRMRWGPDPTNNCGPFRYPLANFTCLYPCLDGVRAGSVWRPSWVLEAALVGLPWGGCMYCTVQVCSDRSPILWVTRLIVVIFRLQDMVMYYSAYTKDTQKQTQI